MQMNALSMWQPWAALVAIRAKAWETRGWAIPANGQPLAIHAAKLSLEAMLRKAPGAKPLLGCVALKHAMDAAWRANNPAVRNGLVYGALICVVKPVETLTTVEALRLGRISEIEYQFGDYREFDDKGNRRYCTHFEVMRVFNEPIYCAGRQKFFRVEVPE